MKQFDKISVFDLMDECPQEICDKFLGDGYRNQSYTTIITQKNDNILSDWLIEQGYPENEKVLIKISW